MFDFFIFKIYQYLRYYIFIHILLSTSRTRWEKNGNSGRFYFLGLQTHCRQWLQPIKRCLLLGRKAITNLDSILKSRDITLPTKVHIAKGIVFPVVLYGCGSWTIKKAGCQRTDASELWCWRRLSLDRKEIKPVNPKGNQPCIFIGSWTDAEAEAPILWTLDVKSWLTGKDPDVGKDWRQEGKGMTKDEMVRWHHRLNGREFEQTLGEWRGKPDVLQSVWSQRLRGDFVTEQHKLVKH